MSAAPEAQEFNMAAHIAAARRRDAEPAYRKAWADWRNPKLTVIPAIARFIVTVPAATRPKMDLLWIYAGLTVRGLMTRDECCDGIIADIHESARRIRPDYPLERARAGVHAAFDRYVAHIEADIIAHQERIRWKLRGMMRAMPPTAEDPEGRRRPTSAELLAAARAIAGDVLWTGPDHAIDEVTPVVEDEVLEALRRQRMKRR